MDGKYPFIDLKSNGLRLVVSVPDRDNGFYRGTRFDHAGVFGRIEYKGIVFSDKWLDGHDPYRHDSLTGPVEEFSQNGYEDAVPGGLFVKPGVGILRREDRSPYDWFHLYPVEDEGKREVQVMDDGVVFRQVISGAGYGYAYTKSIRIGDEPGSFSIDHSLQNTGMRPLSGFVYNHNFFTLGGRGVGPWTRIDLPFEPSGTWRSEYDSVAVDGRGFRFLRPLRNGEVVYMGNVHNAGGPNTYGFSISSVLPALASGGTPDVSDDRSAAAVRLNVEVISDAELHHSVFWGINRVACIEPHTPYYIPSGATLRWSVRYRLSAEQ